MIAEGIEDEDTLDFIRHLDDSQLSLESIIQGGQGYGLGRPSADINSRLPFKAATA